MQVGLVLGGGGARGYAHIGVLKAFEEAEVIPVAIAGCSMGGIVGALYAAGHSPDDIHAMAGDVSILNFVSLGQPGGIVGGSGLERLLAEHLPATFAELPIPLTVTAVDIQTGNLVVLRSGALVSALRATSALPGLISPMRLHERVLVDGGVLNNLPVDVVRTMTLESVVAVDVSPPAERLLEFGEDDGWWGRLTNGWRSNRRSLILEVLIKSSELAQLQSTQMRLALHPPKWLIRPDLDVNLKIEDFSRVDEAVEAGYRAARQALERFES
jgi:NTE family protein